MYWGAHVSAGKDHIEKPEGYILHVTHAALEGSAKGSRVRVKAIVDGHEYVLCVLEPGRCEQSSLGHQMYHHGSDVAFSVDAKQMVHLSGYLEPAFPNMPFQDDYDDSEDISDDMEEEEIEEPQPSKKRKNSGENDKHVQFADKAGKKGKLADDKAAFIQKSAEEARKAAQKEEEAKKKAKAAAEEAKKKAKADLEAAKKKAAEPKEPIKAEGKLMKTRKLPGGLEVTDELLGVGKVAKPGAKVAVHYTGRLVKNNKQFDSSKKGKPFTFTLGAGQVIKGWDEGVKGMLVGGKRTLKVPPAMGYGKRGAGGVIPGNAWLNFEVELLGVK